MCSRRPLPPKLRGNPVLLSEYEQIADQVRQTRDSTLQVARRHFSEPVDTLEGTVKSASPEGIEMAEYPGRTFHFSSISMKMSDLVAEKLGRSNRLTRAQAARDVAGRADARRRYLD